ncbi:TPA: AsmA2 domain-containing protein [Morganella morganii]|nr:AsmA2 domain-containing protein [Morganella morganii]
MRRLPGILLTCVIVMVIAAALVLGGLRYLLPQINDYRPQIEQKLSQMTGATVRIGEISGRWQGFGPALTLRDLTVTAPDADISAEKIDLSLDIWRTLFRFQVSFRDLTFWHMKLDYKQPLSSDGSSIETDDAMSGLWLERFDNFDLRDSEIRFLTPSGDPATLLVSRLSWLNQSKRHRAQGEISLSSVNNPRGWLQVRLDLRDVNGLLDEGTVYLQADDIDMTPWFSRWLRDNTGLNKAGFSLAGWMTVEKGTITRGLVRLNSGEADWLVGKDTHTLEVQDLLVQMRRQGEGWLFNIPDLLNLKTDGQQWPEGSLSLLYIPPSAKYGGNPHLRIRANDIELARLSSIVPTFSFLTNDIVKAWQEREPSGLIRDFALDITPAAPENLELDVSWQDVSWKAREELPSVSHFSGVLRGGQARGILRFALDDSVLDYRPMFTAPLAVSESRGQVQWNNTDGNFSLWSDNLDLQSGALRANGNFRYQHDKDRPPSLGILGGVTLTDAGEAWRYFPVPLMGEFLSEYLTQALIAGKAENATVIFQGNPADFPFRKNEGQFQIWVPLRDATFKYDQEWPALINMDADLNFHNQGLWISAQEAKLGEATARNLKADIPDFMVERLYIQSDIEGKGESLGKYFDQTPMKSSIGNTLEQLKIGGEVKGDLKLEIPLNFNEMVRATGHVNLKNNDIDVVPLGSTLKGVSGQFRFDNGDLESDRITAHWFGQPLNIRFTTKENPSDFAVNIDLDGNWQMKGIDGVPAAIKQHVTGSFPWTGEVNIALPQKGEMSYTVDLEGQTGKLTSSTLPAVRRWAAESGTLNVHASGTEHTLKAGGTVGKSFSVLTDWRLGDILMLNGAAVVPGTKVPEKVTPDVISIALPPISGEEWVGALAVAGQNHQQPASLKLPGNIDISAPYADFAGQRWNQVKLRIHPQENGWLLSSDSQELRGDIRIPASGPWQASIDYLYYNPESIQNALPESQRNQTTKTDYRVGSWPAVTLRCEACWVSGLNIGTVNAKVWPENNSLVLDAATVKNSASELTLSGRWDAGPEPLSHFKGQFKGPVFDNMAAYFGVLVPITGSPFNVDFDPSWRDVPWSPDVATLNGIISTSLGKGAIERMGGGNAGKLLRLVSFDALLRKLQLDFTDTFSNDFVFDSIRGKGVIKDGILNTTDTRVDGLMADISFSGSVYLVERRIDMSVVVTPELSATVGVATAFVVNPIAGAAVFVASKVLGPLWSKISVIRYHLSGSLEEPKIDEVLRQLKETRE